MKTNLIKGLGVTVLILMTIAFKTNPIEKKKVNVKASKIAWTGKKLTGSHQGYLKIKKGHFTFDEEELTGGEFVLDMTSISVADLTGKDKNKLENHLASDDFFGVKKFPTAKLVITNAVKKGAVYGVNADLTIKGITKPIMFDLRVKENSASTKLTVDRTKYGVKYGSGSFFDNLGDNAIYDDFHLEVDLKF